MFNVKTLSVKYIEKGEKSQVAINLSFVLSEEGYNCTAKITILFLIDKRKI